MPNTSPRPERFGFALSAEQLQLRATAQAFAKERLASSAAERDRSRVFPKGLIGELASLGFLGMKVPLEDGGGGADNTAYVLAMEAIAEADASIAVILASSNLSSTILAKHGTAAQKARWLLPYTEGKLGPASFALTEPGAGSDVAGLRTTARREGDAWVLHGSKLFITNGVHANLYFIAARTGTARHEISIFAVEKGTPGFTVGRQLDKTGWLSSDTAELHFENCRIPADHLLGEEGRGFYAVMKNFQTERIALGAMAVGHCTQALRLAVEHARQREAFGGTLWDKQAVRQRLTSLSLHQ